MSTLPHRRNFCERPLAWLAAAFAAGVLLASLTSANLKLCLALAALASAASLVSALRRHASAPYFVIVAFTFAGATLASLDVRDSQADARVHTLYERGLIRPGEPVELTGVMERAPEYAPDGFLFDLNAE